MGVESSSDSAGKKNNLDYQFVNGIGGNRYGMELIYANKVQKQKVIKATMPIFLKKLKVFGQIDKNDWHNQIILGDNLRILKTVLLLKERGILRNKDGSQGIRLIYIDPPFGTGDTYSRNKVSVYSARLTGTDYLEWLRRRIILLRELLSENGSLYVRTDCHFGHYLKVLLDEIFGVKHFRNEIILNRTKKIFDGVSRFNTATDSLFFYTKTENYLFNGLKKPRIKQKWIPMHSPGIRWTKVDSEYVQFFKQEDLQERKGVVYSRGRVFEEKVLIPPDGRHWTFTQQRLEQYRKEGRIRINRKNGIPEYLTSDKEIVDSNWTDIPGYSFKWNFPTENSEQLLERIMIASSNDGDVVLDAFAGSGTTGAVAEKMGRRWIMIDSSRTSAFTMLRRMVGLKKKIGNKGERIKPAPFSIYEAQPGYNIGMPKLSFSDEFYQGIIPSEEAAIPFDSYVRLALALFRCHHNLHFLNAIRIDGTLDHDPVIVYDWQGKEKQILNEDYIRQLHSRIRNRRGDRLFIIAPAPLISFYQDSILLNNKEYHILKIPNSVLTELFNGGNRWLRAESEIDISHIINTIALDLIYPPAVRCCYTIENGGPDESMEAVIKILDFKSHVFSREPLTEKETGINSLSMVSIDYDYSGEFFRMEDSWEFKDLARQDFEIRFPIENLHDVMMIIYTDTFGNERKEVKSPDDFQINTD